MINTWPSNYILGDLDVALQSGLRRLLKFTATESLEWMTLRLGRNVSQSFPPDPISVPPPVALSCSRGFSINIPIFASSFSIL